MAIFSRKRNFATFVRFFNIITYTFRFNKKLRVRTNRIKESYNNCKAAFSAECNHCSKFYTTNNN